MDMVFINPSVVIISHSTKINITPLCFERTITLASPFKSLLVSYLKSYSHRRKRPKERTVAVRK